MQALSPPPVCRGVGDNTVRLETALTNTTRTLALKLRARIKAAFLSGVVLLAPASASAQTVTTYATGANNPFKLSFDRSGQLYVAEPAFDRVSRVPVGGGSATLLVINTPGSGLGGIIGPDDALYVPNENGEVYRYAPGATTADASAYATGFAGRLYALAFDDAGRLYGATYDTATIYRTPSGGGAASSVCTLPTGTFTIVISAAGNPLAVSESDARIYQCAGSTVSTFGVLPDGDNYALTKDAEGNIYSGLFSGANAGEIYRFPPNGGASTLVARVQGASIYSLAFKNADLYAGDFNTSTVLRIANVAPPPAPAPVPTMTEWAMILFAMMLAGGAALHLQRRRQFA